MKSLTKKVLGILGILFLLFVVQFVGAVSSVQDPDPAVSDTSAGYMNVRDILLVVIIVFAIIGMILVF
jgi:hypothetical protein